MFCKMAIGKFKYWDVLTDSQAQGDNLSPLVEMILEGYNDSSAWNSEVKLSEFSNWIGKYLKKSKKSIEQTQELLWAALAIIDVVKDSIDDLPSMELDKASILVNKCRELLLKGMETRLRNEKEDLITSIEDLQSNLDYQNEFIIAKEIDEEMRDKNFIDEYVAQKNWLHITEDDAEEDWLLIPKDQTRKKLHDEWDKLDKERKLMSDAELLVFQQSIALKELEDL